MVCTARYKHGRGDHYFLRGMTRAMPSSFHLNNGRARVHIRTYKPSRLETIPLFSKYNTKYESHVRNGAWCIEALIKDF